MALHSRIGTAAATICAFLALSAPAASLPPETLSGTLNLVWGDPGPGCQEEGALQLFLTGDDGCVYRLDFPASVELPMERLLLLCGRRVHVQGQSSALPTGEPAARFFVQDLASDEPTARLLRPSISGNLKYVTLMVKFSDVSTEPKNLAYFQGMYGSSAPGLDHYWRELSFDNVNIVGSQCYGWFTLPQPRSYYITGSPETANLDQLWLDATAAADATVDFSQFHGINIMFNDTLDCCAWGGSKWGTLDGVTRSWPSTWEPPWAYSNISVIAHEMGHSMGMPHSSGNYGYTYDNYWDVMSKDRLCNPADATYGCVAAHTIGYHKADLEGWIAGAQQVFVPPGQQSTVSLERIAQPQTTNPQYIKLPVKGSASRFFTVEARRYTGYDNQLYNEGVVIHHVLTGRTNPARVMDVDLDGNTSDAQFLPGQAFCKDGVKVTVNSATTYGYSVTVRNALPPNVMDLDADSFFDLAGRAAASGDWWAGLCSGSALTTVKWGRWSPGTTWSPFLKGDFNGDGRTDVAGRTNSTGDWYVGLSTGSAFATSSWGRWSAATTWTDVMTGDFNGDGKTDLVGRAAATGDWYVGLSTGTSFSTSKWGNWSPSATWLSVRRGDFNGDGKTDLAGRAASSGIWWVALSTGSAFTTSNWGTWSPGTTWVDVLNGDFNGDGKEDLAGRASATGVWWIAASNGSAFVTSNWGQWSPATTWNSVRAGDFDGDGLTDVAGRAASTGDWWVALAKPTWTFTTTKFGKWSPDVTWTNIETSDCNGDGRADLVGRAANTGSWWAARSNGSAFTTIKLGTWSPATTWEMAVDGDGDN